MEQAASLEQRFSFLLKHADQDLSLTLALPANLKKLRADASLLCADIRSLRELDPLGPPLTAEAQRGQRDEGSKAVATNRDAYIQWESKRALEDQKKTDQMSGSTAGTAKGASKAGSTKRERAVASVDAHDSSNTRKHMRVGSTADIEVSLI